MSRRRTTPDVRFTVGGEGTTSEPAVITFAVVYAVRSDWRQSVPATVAVEEDRAGHYVMRGVDSAMTRSELTSAFYQTFPRDEGWWCKGEDA